MLSVSQGTSYSAAFCDSSVQPIYYQDSDKGNKTWLFHYQGGFIDFPAGCHPNTYNRYICDYDTVDYISYPLDCVYNFESYNVSCVCNVTIASAYACPGCVYRDQGIVLNVNMLRNETIHSHDGKYFYLYSPCWNNIECNNGNEDNKTMNAMAVKYDIVSGKCAQTLAVWNEDYNVTYYPRNETINEPKTWKVEYFNGQSCNENNDNAQFIVN